jgi:hypothetical protein
VGGKRYNIDSVVNYLRKFIEQDDLVWREPKRAALDVDHVTLKWINGGEMISVALNLSEISHVKMVIWGGGIRLREMPFTKNTFTECWAALYGESDV